MRYISFKKLAIVAGLSLSAAVSHAVVMTGGVGLGGTFDPNNQNLTLATTVNITAFVSDRTGTFLSEGDVALGSAVPFFNPLVVNPATIPPAGTALYTFGTAGRYQFHVTALNQSEAPTTTSLDLFGTGFFRDTSGEYEDTFGTWLAGFERQGTGDLATFSFSSSSMTDGRVPDGGSSIALLGLGLVVVAALRRRLA
jgi:hypothetical protein